MKCPCDDCLYEWVDVKNNCSCKDECKDYQGYLILVKIAGKEGNK